MRDALNLNYPIKNGIVEDWDSLTRILDHCITNDGELNIDDPREYNVFLTEPIDAPDDFKEQLAEIMFES